MFWNIKYSHWLRHIDLSNSCRCIVPRNEKDIEKFNTTGHSNIQHTNSYRQIIFNKICIIPYPVREELNSNMHRTVGHNWNHVATDIHSLIGTRPAKTQTMLHIGPVTDIRRSQLYNAATDTCSLNSCSDKCMCPDSRVHHACAHVAT